MADFEQCGFCHKGMVPSTPGQPLDGCEPCPYCEGTGKQVPLTGSREADRG